jgi:N-acetylneuraminate synthase
LSRGHIISKNDLTTKRPGTGISAELIDTLIGRKLMTDVLEDTLLEWNQLG